MSVPSGRMRNELHRKNGAAYVLKGEPLRIPLVSREKVLERQRKETAERQAAEASLLEAQLALEQSKATGRVNAQAEMLNALENLTNLNFNLGGASATGDGSANTTGSASQSTNSSSDLFFLETSIKDLPAVISYPVSVQATGFISPPVTNKDFSNKVKALIDNITIDPASISFKVQVERGSAAVDSSVIDFVGTYSVNIQLSPDRVISKRIRVVPKEPFPEFEKLRRPFDHPLPGATSAEVSAESESSVAQKDEAASSTEGSTPSSVKKTFEWENDFIANMKK